MKYFLIALLITLTIGLAYTNIAYGGKTVLFIGIDYPYTIYKDDGVIRYCMEPEIGDISTSCWSNGEESICKLLTKDEGFIDC